MKIMIIGCCGAGKSTLARQLHQKTGIDLIHLDQVYFYPNWEEPTSEDWTKKVKELVQKPNWIMDGNYGGTMDFRLQTADIIVFLDRSRWVCVYRILKRIILNYGKTRIDSAEGCKERFDWGFLGYTFHFNDVKRPKIVERLAKLSNDKQIFTLQSDKSVQQFLDNYTSVRRRITK